MPRHDILSAIATVTNERREKNRKLIERAAEWNKKHPERRREINQRYQQNRKKQIT